jgi:hypothetical protein
VEAGRPTTLHLALLAPPKTGEDWRILPPRPYFQYLDLNLLAEVEVLEEEMARQARVREVLDGSGERAILVGVDLGEGPEAEAGLEELSELTRTAGGVPVKKVLVFRQHLDPRYLVGLGKLEELKSLAYHENASTLIFGLELTPAQAREIERATGLKVLDRTQLILDIFAPPRQDSRGPGPGGAGPAQIPHAQAGGPREGDEPPRGRYRDPGAGGDQAGGGTGGGFWRGSPTSPGSLPSTASAGRRPGGSARGRACP